MAYNEYGDPSFNYEVLKKKEAGKRMRKQIKEEDGCSACVYRDAHVGGKYWTCKENHIRTKGNYCKHWWLDQERKYG